MDTKEAFPKIVRQATRAAIAHSGIPTPLQPAVLATLSQCGVLVAGDRRARPAFFEHSGVSQRCPLSSTLFVITVEPLHNMVEATVPCVTLLMAYADDIGMILNSARRLGDLVDHKKMVLVPLAPPSAPPLATPMMEMQGIVAALPPPWRELRIERHTKYLGVQIGPCSVEEFSAEPASKNWLIASCPPQSHFSTTLCERLRAWASTLKVMSISKGFVRTELRVLAQLFRAPPCAYLQGFMYRAEELGLPRVPPLREWAAAHLLSAARRYTEVSRRCVAELSAVREAHLLLRFLAADRPIEPGWRILAIALQHQRALGLHHVPALVAEEICRSERAAERQLTVAGLTAVMKNTAYGDLAGAMALRAHSLLCRLDPAREVAMELRDRHFAAYSSVPPGLPATGSRSLQPEEVRLARIGNLGWNTSAEELQRRAKEVLAQCHVQEASYEWLARCVGRQQTGSAVQVLVQGAKHHLASARSHALLAKIVRAGPTVLA